MCTRFQWSPCGSLAAVHMVDDVDEDCCTLWVLNMALEPVFSWPSNPQAQDYARQYSWACAMPAWAPCGTLSTFAHIFDPDRAELHQLDIGWPSMESAAAITSAESVRHVLASLGLQACGTLAWGRSGGLAAVTTFTELHADGRWVATAYVQMPDRPMASTSVSSTNRHAFRQELVWSPTCDRLLLLSDNYLGLVSASGSCLLQLDNECRGRASFSPDGQLFVAVLAVCNSEQSSTGPASSSVGAGGDQACLGVYKVRDGTLVFTKTWDGSASEWELVFSSEGSRLYLHNTNALHVVHFGPEVGGCNSIQLCSAVAGACKQLG